jgi:predicted permease
MHDLRSAFRHLVKSPGFSAVAIITLALALGVNSAIFSIVNGLVLKPTMTREPDRVVSVFTATKQASNRDYREFSHQEYTTLCESTGTFSEVTAAAFTLAGIGEGDGLRRALTFLVADNFFAFTGTRPAAGRFFTTEETRPNAQIPVVVASHSLWQRMGGRPDFVGSTLRVNGHPHTVVGVTPEGFAGISVLISPDVWLPLGMYGLVNHPFSDSAAVTDLNQSTNHALILRARLAPGLDLEMARARLSVLDARLNAVLPPDGEPRSLQITPPSRFSIGTGPSDDGPLALMGTLLCAMAGIVLLIASLNLANLLLARGSARAREIAVRMAVGATRWQIVRQLTLEGLLLALIGGVVGLMLSSWANAVMEASFQTLLASVSFSLSTDLQPDARVLLATFGFCVLATLVFSVGPAWRSARADLVHDLKAQGGEPATTGRFNRFFAGRHVLVMTQMALSLALVFGSGLFLRGALNASGMDLGFKTGGAAVATIDYSLTNVPAAEGLRRVLDVTDRVRALPGVHSAGITSLLPYGNMSKSARLEVAETTTTRRSPEDLAAGVNAVHAAISPGYLASLGVTLLRGRDFTEIEARDRNAPPVAIIDEGLAQQLFPDDDALGRRIRYAQTHASGKPNDLTIVGIVNRHRQEIHDKGGANRRLYIPLGQSTGAAVFLMVRYVREDPRAVLAALPGLRQQLRGVDPEIPLLQIVPLRDIIDKSIALWIVRLGAVMFGVFGGIALVLATVGVYGVKAFMVERRTREIGIRMALGAGRGSVFALIMRQGVLQTLVACLAGGGLALLIGRALAGMLYEVSPSDPLVLLGAAALLIAAALLACWLPARRATRVDPNVALRAE